ncbi:hypothetical protein Rsub_12902 [Raphidocelis subcapitata]|uniref:Uncharacterized protein n=1 Tax=Raphidocelis subcapitata TaxID=307507 RepID=A0A2V0PRP6_9CHLO|nr:hypothetical protein Rsub_12902 [Raphidocelis subcapitata]|eukprot:GBG00258.1 hypothetical protein Rsub_12902 [Raphidocelis subcapitata]
MASLLWQLTAPSYYLTLASLALLQFSVLLSALSNFATHAARTPALEALAPVAKALLRTLEGTWGPAYKFQPSATQVTLVALMLAFIAEGRR